MQMRPRSLRDPIYASDCHHEALSRSRVASPKFGSCVRRHLDHHSGLRRDVSERQTGIQGFPSIRRRPVFVHCLCDRERCVAVEFSSRTDVRRELFGDSTPNDWMCAGHVQAPRFRGPVPETAQIQLSAGTASLRSTRLTRPGVGLDHRQLPAQERGSPRKSLRGDSRWTNGIVATRTASSEPHMNDGPARSPAFHTGWIP